MTRNRLGLRARFLMVATAVACWIPCVPAAAAGMPLPQVPPAPPSLTATPVGSSIRLTWRAPTWSDQSFRDHRLPDRDFQQRPPGGSRSRTNTGSTDPQYLHANPPRNTIVWYRVAAINAGGTGDHSGQSNQVETTGSTGPGTPGAPRNLTAFAVGTAIDLNWDEPFPTPGKTISGYQVNVSTNGGVNFVVSDEYDRDRVPAFGSSGRRHPPLRGQGAVLRQHRRAPGVRERHHGGDRDTGCTPEPERNGRWPDGHRRGLGRAGFVRRERDHRLPGRNVNDWRCPVDAADDHGPDLVPAHESHRGRHPPLPGQGEERQRLRALDVRGERHHVNRNAAGATPRPDGDGRRFVGDRPELEGPGGSRQQRDHRVSDRVVEHANANRRMDGS